MLVPNRHGSSADYRYGFNGKEKDDEVKGEGNFENYGMRMYNNRIGRFISVDPLFKDYPWNSTYAFAENDVVRSLDLDGLEKEIYTFTFKDKQWGVTKQVLKNAGPLGDGVLVKFGSKYFYGNQLPKGTTGEDYTKTYEKFAPAGYKINNEKGGHVTIGYGHLAISKEDQAKYKVGTKITPDEADELFATDYKAREVDLPGLTDNQNDAVTDAGFKFYDTAKKIQRKFNSFNGPDKANFVLKGTSTSFTGNKVRAAANYILFKYSEYVKIDYSESAQHTWKNVYDKLTPKLLKPKSELPKPPIKT
jgi:RHS repeat-associated protein